MTTTQTAATAPAPDTVAAPRRWDTRRWWVLAGFLGLFFLAVALWGVPLERSQIMILCVGAALIVTWGGGAATGRSLARDFIAIGLLLTAYDRVRGNADDLGLVRVQYLFPIHADRLLTGTVPTLWLQHRLYSGGLHWWEALVSLVYLSHFFMVWVVLTLLWVRRRDLVRAWTNRFLAVTALALLGYALFPQAPPWLAAQDGALPPVLRTTSRGLDFMGLHFAGRWLHDGAAVSNQVASMPSVHSAYPFLILVFFWNRGPRRLRPLLVAYPLAMTFTLVLTGEHYLIDVLAGWLLVALVHLAPGAWTRIRKAT